MGKRTSSWIRRAQIFMALCILSLGLVTIGLSQDHTTVYVVPVKDTIDLGLAEFMKRAFLEAGAADAIMLEIDTFGGRVDAATEIRDLIFSADIPIISYVTNRAWSAGALIAMAGDHLIMMPGSSIGAAEPQPADPKTISALKAEFESTAERTNRNRVLAAGMVDSDVIIEDITEVGKIITLTALDANELGFSEGIAATRHQAASMAGFEDARFYEIELNTAEKLARFLTDPTISSLLLTIGFLGIILEVTTAGWGVPGTVGLIGMALFFGGRMVVGLAGWGTVGLFIIGLLLLAVEAFLIPGFGVSGVGGLVAVFMSITMSFAEAGQGARSILLAFVLTIIGTFLAFKYLPRTRTWGRLILSHKQSGDYVAANDRKNLKERVGKSITVLRPSGVIDIDGERIDAVTEGSFIQKGVEVVVIRVEGSRIVVREKL